MEKIRERHRERTAYVYIRQSSLHQVREHLESGRRQYELADYMRRLGFERVMVIDEDQGRSAAGLQERPGFERLVAAVCSGEAGAVAALEASRLARNNRDWHHLVDLCALTETLVIDQEGVYDPQVLNDRLLLGLKGTMSEFELSLMRQRAHEARRQMIERGEVLWEVPVGYVRTENNGIEMTPDRQVQQAVRSVFHKFDEVGSARQVLLWFRDQGILLPVSRSRSDGREVDWHPATNRRVLAILKNPCYAGAFAYGRTESRTQLEDHRPHKTAGHPRPREEWEVLRLDHHEGYISWAEYLRHEAQLEANLAKYGTPTGAARSGDALLAGLLRCARCGRKLHVTYSGSTGRVVRYSCRGAQINHGTQKCISVGGMRLDRAVSSHVLEAVQPAGVEASLAAAEERRAQEDDKRKALRLAVEKAEYEVARARRQYDAVDPENRLVAGELEARWDGALEQLDEARRRYETVEAQAEALSPEERQRLFELGVDLQALWDHPQASNELKKRVLRCVLKEIVVDVQDEDERPETHLTLHWEGGVHTGLVVSRNGRGQHRYSADGQVIDTVRALTQVCDDRQTAAILNRLGYRTGRGNTWKESRVKSLRHHHDIPAFDPGQANAATTLAGAAEKLGVSPTFVRRLIAEGTLPARQVVPFAPWIIEESDLAGEGVQEAVRAVKEGRARPRTVPGQSELPL